MTCDCCQRLSPATIEYGIALCVGCGAAWLRSAAKACADRKLVRGERALRNFLASGGCPHPRPAATQEESAP